MEAAISLLTALSADPDPDTVSPGIWGFLSFFVLAVALIFLVRSMNAHLRKVRYRQERLEKLEAEEAAVAAAKAPVVADNSTVRDLIVPPADPSGPRAPGS